MCRSSFTTSQCSSAQAPTTDRMTLTRCCVHALLIISALVCGVVVRVRANVSPIVWMSDAQSVGGISVSTRFANDYAAVVQSEEHEYNSLVIQLQSDETYQVTNTHTRTCTTPARSRTHEPP